MLSLALIGDLHVHERSPRFAHVLEVLDWAKADAEAQGVTEFVFLGDLCEGAPNPREFSALQQRLEGLVVQGNHEHPETGLMFDGQGCVVAWDRCRVVNFPEARVLLIPYPRRGRPPFDDLQHDGSIADSMRAAAARIADAVNAELEDLHGAKPLLVFGHVTIEGMTAGDSEFEVHSATEVVVPREAFEGVAFAAVGHIHRAQNTDGPGRWSYCRKGGITSGEIVGVGSLIRHSFAEQDDEKSYTLVTVDQGRVSWERRVVLAREQLVETMDWQAAPSANHTAASILAMQALNREVKLTVRIAEDRLASFDASVFDPVREAAAHFVLERVTLSPERARAPRLARASSVAEQFLGWTEATSLELPDGRRLRLLEKITGLST